MENAIDLGQSPEETMPMAAEPKDGPYYPTFEYAGSTPLEIPDSGTMTISFSKKRSSQSEDEGGERHTCTIEVQKILSVKAGAPDEEQPAGEEGEASPAGGDDSPPAEEAEAPASKRAAAMSAVLNSKEGEY